MDKRRLLNDRNWIVFTSGTSDPKLAYIEYKLNHAGIKTHIVSTEDGKKLLVPYNKISHAWKQLKPDLDNMRDDHPFFKRWKRAVRK